MSIILLSIIIPFAAGAACLFIPNRLKGAKEAVSLLAAVATACFACMIFIKKPLALLVENSLYFKADSLSGFIILAVAAFAILILIYSFKFMQGKERLREYYAYILWTLGASIGAALAANLILLVIFWGFLGATLYLLIGLSENASAAAKKTFIIIGGSDAVLLLGLAIIWMKTGSMQMAQAPVALDGIGTLAFLCVAVAAFAKAGAMPFHSWVPDTAEEAHVPVTAYLPASLDKLLGIYLLARATMDIFVMNKAMYLLLLIVGSVTIIAAVMMAIVQHDTKRLLGYHAVSQVGYMVLGIGTGNPIGIAGGLFHMLNNAIYKSCLFLSSGSVEQKTETSDLDKLGGLGKLMPLTFLSFLVASLSISGIPPFNGFVSKWMIYQGVVEFGKNGDKTWIIWLCAAMFGSALTLASFMKLIYSIFLGQQNPELGTKDIKESPMAITLPILILALLCAIFGIFAFVLPLRWLINPAVKASQEIIGLWAPSMATIMLIMGIVIGLIIYALGTTKKVRQARAFVGGEEIPASQRVTGVDFYNTIKDVGPLKNIYAKAQEKRFDPYEVGSRITFFFSGILQKLHSGLLPVYLIWCLLGMAVLYYVLLIKR